MSRWRRHGRVALLALVVASFAWGGVRLADPMPKSPEMRTVDGSDPPAEIAYDAMMQTEEGNYAYVLGFGNGTSRERVARVQIDTADRQFEAIDRSGSDPQRAIYGGEGGTWKRYGSRGSWIPTWDRWPGQTAFQTERAVREPDADVSLVARNETTVVVRVTDTETAMKLDGDDVDSDREQRASLTLVVDRERGVLRRSVYRMSWLEEADNASSRRTSVVVRQYRRWGMVDVRRPTGLPYGFAAVVQDVVNWCPHCEEAGE